MTAQGLAGVPHRWDFAFAPDGRRAARMSDAGGAIAVEVLDFEGAEFRETVFRPETPLPVQTYLSVPSAPDRLSCWAKVDGGFTVTGLRRAAVDEPWQAQGLVELDVVGLRLTLEHPSGAWQPMWTLGADGVSTLWRVDWIAGEVRELARLPGATAGGVWIDDSTLAVDVSDDRGTNGYLLDLAADRYHRLVHVTDDSDDGIALYDRRRRLVVLTTNALGERRVALADVAGGGLATFLPDLPGGAGAVEPCCLTGDGASLVLLRQRGVRSELWLVDLDDYHLTGPLAMPDGSIAPAVVAAGDRLRFAYSSPSVPAAVASWSASDGFRLDEAPDLPWVSPDDLASTHVTVVAGPHGPLEALVYEPPASAPLRPVVIVALHGGPVSQWSCDFVPELHSLAGAGATVIAPNCHGSTGYGADFVRALQGRAGSVDVDDVVAVIEAVRRSTPAPPAVVVYGESYGGFLALLLASTRPDLCDGVIAVAPVVSMPALVATASPAVGRLVGALAGAGAERFDLLRDAAALRCPALIAYGSADPVIPPGQCRALAEALHEHDAHFLELEGEGHTIVSSGARRRLYREMQLFLARIGTRHASPHRRKARAGRQPMTRGVASRQLFDTIEEEVTHL